MKPEHFRIILDMDGVLADLVTFFLYLLQRRYGVILKPEEVTRYSFHECHPELTPEIYGFFDEPGFFRYLDPMPGAQEGLKKLMEDGFDVSILTACYEGHKCKRDWIKDHTSDAHYKKLKRKINFSHEKQWYKGDVFVDDSLDNLYAYQKENPEAFIICFDAPYNKEWTGERAKDWTECYQLIKDHYSWICGQMQDTVV